MNAFQERVSAVLLVQIGAAVDMVVSLEIEGRSTQHATQDYFVTLNTLNTLERFAFTDPDFKEHLENIRKLRKRLDGLKPWE